MLKKEKINNMKRIISLVVVLLLAFGCTAFAEEAEQDVYNSGDINYIHRCRNGSLRLAKLGQCIQTTIRDICRTKVRLYGTERKIGALGLA